MNSDGTQRALTVTNGTGDTTFSGAIGGSAPVKSLTITSDQLTAGAITLNGALTLLRWISSILEDANGASTTTLLGRQWHLGLRCFEHLYWYAGECGNIDSFGIGRLSDSTAVTVDSGLCVMLR